MADLQHATENDTDLHGDPDARHWAERFVQRVTEHPEIPASEGAMLAWFAGAIETGRMQPFRLFTPPKGDRILPDYQDVLGQELNEAVMIALGAASMCWDPGPGGAVFESERAEQIGKELIGIIVQFAQLYGQAKPV